MNDHKLMLTVLVPVYNTDITSLADSLVKEIGQMPVERRVSIIFLDDASPDTVLTRKNQSFVSSIKDCQVSYFVARRNNGRSEARNRLIRMARAEWLLFLDADVMPDRADFLRNYLDLADSGNYDVICGGTSYEQRTMPGREYDFYFSFMKDASLVPVQKKNLDKWRYVLTSNIFARRRVFAECRFDRRFKTYGYEDQEWAIRAESLFRVIHVENSVSHLGLLTRKEFFRKMRISIGNYLLLKKLHPDVFARTALARVIRVLTAAPVGALRIAGSVFAMVCDRLPLPAKLLYVFYQLEKAFLLAVLIIGDNQKSGLTGGHES